MEDEDWRVEYQHLRELPSTGLCGLSVFMFTTGLMVGLDSTGYRGRYCYEKYRDALSALQAWRGAGDPPGPWIKYKGVGGERLGPGAGEKFEFDRTEK